MLHQVLLQYTWRVMVVKRLHNKSGRVDDSLDDRWKRSELAGPHLYWQHHHKSYRLCPKLQFAMIVCDHMEKWMHPLLAKMNWQLPCWTGWREAHHFSIGIARGLYYSATSTTDATRGRNVFLACMLSSVHCFHQVSLRFSQSKFSTVQKIRQNMIKCHNANPKSVDQRYKHAFLVACMLETPCSNKLGITTSTLPICLWTVI
jgi:hypothetical protein